MTNTSTDLAPTVDIVTTLLSTVDAGLVAGLGSQIPGEMCIEAAVCYAYGLPHGDQPACVGSAVRSYKIGLNDSNWPSPAARAKGMRRAAVAQLGSVDLDQVEFAQRLALETIRRVLPVALDAAGVDSTACREAVDLAAAGDAAGGAAALAAWDAAWAARAAARAAWDAAWDAAWAARAAARAAAWAAWAAQDQTLTLAADMLVQILVDMGSPGAAFLYLCDEVPA
jgi:hypothetical protein